MLTFPWTRMHREALALLRQNSDRILALESDETPSADLTKLENGVEKALEDIQTIDGVTENLAEQFEVLRLAHKATIIAVAEGIERVERYERRIKATVARAKKELAEQGFEHAGIEAEAAELGLVNGGGGEAVPVRPVPNPVAASASPTRVKGVVTRAKLRNARGA